MRVEKIDFYLDPASFAPMKRAVGKRFLDAMVDYQINEQTKYTPSTTNGAAAPKTAD